MKALLLAAGKATRLGELSNTTPKCLHRVGDEVLLDRLVRQLREAGVTDFLINAHHLAERIGNHVSALPDPEHITLVHEEELLGTLGTLRSNVDFFGGADGWVLHADNFIEGSLVPLRAAFQLRPVTSWGVLLTFQAQDPSSCGVVMSDSDSIVTGFFEKVPDPPSDQASAATFIFDARALHLAAQLPAASTDISIDLIPKLVGRISAFEHSGDVIDIGTVEGLARARRAAFVPPSSV